MKKNLINKFYNYEKDFTKLNITLYIALYIKKD